MTPGNNAMHLAALKSSRYDIGSVEDRFSRNHLFVEEARKYPNILECGCSTGFVSRLITKSGSRVVGIEIDPEAAEQARRFCANVLNINLNDRDWAQRVGAQFNLITFGDVLEHLLDPQATLRDAMQVLAPGGRVLISLPNIAHWTMRVELARGKFEYQSIGLLDYTHIRFFTVATARKMIQDAGYRILRFHPVFGGRFTNHFRPIWQQLANWFPNLWAFQMLFLAEPDPDSNAHKPF
jgi:2-polyprenyl-3-methyl-5-hydroxy-6-metoxy-1,4-benzoquinol methylase